MKAKLILENGMIFEGTAFGYIEETLGEVVFNTGMVGYQEVLTDPSYYGQIVTMTYPLIGNYGLNLEDNQSKRSQVKGFIVRDVCEYPNNFRYEMTLQDYLKNNKIMALHKVDTRALTKVLRNSGTMKGIITLEELSKEYVEDKLKKFNNDDAVMKVTTKSIYTIQGAGKHVALIDFGVKDNIIKSFINRNCKVTVFPANIEPEIVLESDPDLIFLSNGPGDPEKLKSIIENIKKFIGKKPIAGICLGHQLLALALGGKTEKLKFGHRGCNHPVKSIENNKVYITSQNHGYYVNELPKDAVITHVSVNDGTVEGMRHNTLPIYSVQFHPEACPGPKDAEGIFDEFLRV